MLSGRTPLLVSSLFLMSMAAAVADTGAPPNSELDKVLRAQNLTFADLETNRAGTVSERQADQVGSHRKMLSFIFFTIVGSLLVMALGLAVYDYKKTHSTRMFILPGIALAFSLILYLIFALFLRLPSVAGKPVIVVEGPIESLIGVVNKGGYVVKIQGVEYKGVAIGLGPTELDLKGKVVKAYVVAESKMVVAIEPI